MLEAIKHMRRLPWDRVLSTLILASVGGAIAWAISIELKASPLQARLLSRLADNLSFAVEPGANSESRFPGASPYDTRLGYAHMPDVLATLDRRNFVIESQARLSPDLRRFMDFGGFAVFPEKSQAGLSIADRDGRTMYRSRHPERVFPDYTGVPPLVVDTLLFVENRELLDERFPERNPAIEWDRFALAAVNVVTQHFDPDNRRFGGSTLATQIEKYRHSPEGRTGSISEKLRQIATASVRAYQDGPETYAARRRIVVDYLNSTPLSARPGFGEVIGLGDGLWAWFGSDLDAAIRALAQTPRSAAEREQQGLLYKQVLSLLLAQRRPSYYLLQGRDDLELLTQKYLFMLNDAGVISDGLRDQAMETPLVFRQDPPTPAEVSFVDAKAANSIRAHLLSLLRVPQFYDLDRFDLRVEATLDAATQQAVVGVLRRLTDPEEAARLGLTGERLLDKSGAGDVIYSVTIYERAEGANLVRVQADNLDRPLDLNEGGKLDLGSTAKLRTLVTYLQVIAEIHGEYAGSAADDLAEAAAGARDPLSRWVLDYLAHTADHSLAGLLDAAMQRKYSASPGEAFFTGGGLHTFANFDKTHNGRIMTVAESFRHSVNLVFIRMMRDIVRYYMADGAIAPQEILESADHPARREYLERFADKEGTVYLDRFLRRYRNKTPDEALTLLAERSRQVPHRLAVVFRSVRPAAGLAEFGSFLRHRLPGAHLDEDEISRLYAAYGPDKFNLHDRGYIARLHPLELWLVAYLQEHPKAPRSAVVAASAGERQEVYAWLFKSKRKRAADSRIRILIEEEAFARVHDAWAKLGYPFPNLVPSYATAIGSSADRPAALAELMGIILNDGIRLPATRIARMHIGEGTPYETHVMHSVDQVERVLSAEVTATVRRALADVVQNGTARRVAGTYADADGTTLTVGGKTGTGDELADRVSAGDKEVSRSAAFVFYIGDRFFGTITAHVPGDQLSRYRFTSALPVQVLKVLGPALQPMVARPRGAPPLTGQLIATADQTKIH
jgi:membrane peptidoglycan carboxypeptidase